jgi:hypothetical protein
VSAPTARARRLRGGLVGACSALVTAAAHVAAGGVLPGGGSLMVLAAVCATVGATATAISVESHRAKIAVLIVTLGAAQVLGHLTLAVTSPHAAHGPAPSALMIAAHAAAAAGVGVLIGLVEHAYQICASVLCWLRLALVGRGGPMPRPARRRTNSVVVQAVLVHAGLGMRAPPRRAVVGA